MIHDIQTQLQSQAEINHDQLGLLVPLTESWQV